MITCTACGYDKNPDDAEYCDACGSELQVVAPAPSLEAPTVIQPEIPEPVIPPPPSPTVIQPEIPSPTPTPTTTATTAKLISKQPNSPVPEFMVDGSSLVGIFNPDIHQ